MFYYLVCAYFRFRSLVDWQMLFQFSDLCWRVCCSHFWNVWALLSFRPVLVPVYVRFLKVVSGNLKKPCYSFLDILTIDAYDVLVAGILYDGWSHIRYESFIIIYWSRRVVLTSQIHLMFDKVPSPNLIYLTFFKHSCWGKSIWLKCHKRFDFTTMWTCCSFYRSLTR